MIMKISHCIPGDSEQRLSLHAHTTLKSWAQLARLIRDRNVIIDGASLDLASVVAIARHGCALAIKDDKNISERIDASVETLRRYLSKGHFVYGVNTGFGESADTRTKDLFGLQTALMQLTQSAILARDDTFLGSSRHEYLESHSMPSAWTRAAILIRCNTNIRGHSAISSKAIDAMIQLIRKDITPVIPLRGSISASGDLMPLSYISGAIQGNPDVFVRIGGGSGAPLVISAEEALRRFGMDPIVLGPKEGLSIINGTAPSAAVACLGLYEANQLAVLSQVLTALSSEALNANNEWLHPFIATIRPHPGQIEAAQNMRSFLKGSLLTYGLGKTRDRFKAGLAQERYALRTAPQWIAPYLEDLVSAEHQLLVEINSTTDNPVVNVKENDVHNGGNFQATAVTSATEKTRLALQAIGRMLFSQTSEMINNKLNNGLPPNLAADDPSQSFCLKGIDINTAAYTSELGYLANPVSSHVQSAEMHNQGINSLALISARQTMASVEILSMIVANCLYTGCQGVDLRTLHITFLREFEAPARQLISNLIDAGDAFCKIFARFWSSFKKAWNDFANLDAVERCDQTSQTLVAVLIAHAEDVKGLAINQLADHCKRLSAAVLEAYLKHRDQFFKNPTTANYLGDGTKVSYRFVRERLGVPLHRGLVEHPIAGHPSGNMIDGRPKKTIGSWVSMIYEAVRDGSLAGELLKFLQTVEAIHGLDELKLGVDLKNGSMIGCEVLEVPNDALNQQTNGVLNDVTARVTNAVVNGNKNGSPKNISHVEVNEVD